MTKQNAKLHSLHFCDVWLMCIIRYVSLQHMQNRNACICGIFPDFLNVSPNKLPERLESHIALDAFVGFHFSVSFQKFLQISCVNRYIAACIGCICAISLWCEV